MKAKEYAKRYLESADQDKELSEICLAMISEITYICSQRHVGSNLGLANVVREQDSKWRAFVRIVDNSKINPDGFFVTLRRNFPGFEEIHNLTGIKLTYPDRQYKNPNED